MNSVLTRTVHLARLMALFDPARPLTRRWSTVDVHGRTLVAGPRMQRFWLRSEKGRGFLLQPAFDVGQLLN